MGKLISQLRELWKLHREVKELRRNCAHQWQKAVMKSRVYRELGRVREEKIRQQRDHLLGLAELSTKAHQSTYAQHNEQLLKQLRIAGQIPEKEREENDKEKDVLVVASQVSKYLKMTESGTLVDRLKGSFRFAYKMASLQASGVKNIPQTVLKEKLIAKLTQSIPMQVKNDGQRELIESTIREGLNDIELDESKGQSDMTIDLMIGAAKKAGMGKEQVISALDQNGPMKGTEDSELLKRKLEQNWSSVKVRTLEDKLKESRIGIGTRMM